MYITVKYEVLAVMTAKTVILCHATGHHILKDNNLELTGCCGNVTVYFHVQSPKSEKSHQANL
jgi:hypothetical protein